MTRHSSPEVSPPPCPSRGPAGQRAGHRSADRRSATGQRAVSQRAVTAVVAGLFCVVPVVSGCASSPAPASSSAPTADAGSPSGSEADTSSPSEAESSAPNPPLPSSTSSGKATAEPSGGASGGAAAEPSTGSSGGSSSASATEIRYIWPDESWEIQSDPASCVGSGGSPSPYTDRPDYFTCGPTAASLLACGTDADDGTVKCIQNPDGKLATRIDDPSVVNYTGAATSDPMPFRVGLDSGTTCSVVSHDHGQHWNGWYSWYTCKDGSELLVPEIDEGAVATFDHTDETWTAQVSSNRQKPAEQPVVWAEYAGQE